jgi:hypothetical protein
MISTIQSVLSIKHAKIEETLLIRISRLTSLKSLSLFRSPWSSKIGPRESHKETALFDPDPQLEGVLVFLNKVTRLAKLLGKVLQVLPSMALATVKFRMFRSGLCRS